MSKIMRRLESGERWWAAEIVFRSIGLGLLVLCAAAAVWLYLSAHRPPPHSFSLLEVLSALVAIVCWSLGWCFLVEGPALFKLIDVPPRHRRFTF